MNPCEVRLMPSFCFALQRRAQKGKEYPDKIMRAVHSISNLLALRCIQEVFSTVRPLQECVQSSYFRFRLCFRYANLSTEN